MRSEILEQPEAIRRTLAGVEDCDADLRLLFADAPSAFFYGIGTSRNAASYGQHVWSVLSGLQSTVCEVESVSTLAADPAPGDGIVVALSQSGESPEILSVAEAARCRRRRVLAITNEGASTLAQLADVAVVTGAGPEQAIPATKSFTSQLCALAAMSKALGYPGYDSELSGVPDAVEGLLERPPPIAALESAVLSSRPIVVAGSGGSYGVAAEIALKLQETAYVPAVALTLTALAHGPIAMLGPGSLLVLVVGEQIFARLAERVSNCAQAQGARVLLLGGTASLQRSCRDYVESAPLPDALRPIPLSVPGQLLAEELSRRLGYEPDTPRGLSKVTRTDTWRSDACHQ